METEIDKLQETLNDKTFYELLAKKIKYFSSFLSTQNTNNLLFNKHKYNSEKIKHLNNAIIPNLFISIINKFNEGLKHKTNTDIIFISNIISKLFNEKIIMKDDLLKISKHILDIKKYEAFLEIMKLTQLNDLFEQMKSLNLSKLDKIFLRKILSKNPKYIKCILSINTNKYSPNKFISSLFSLKFNLNLLSIEDLLINEYRYANIDNPFPLNYILNIFKVLTELFETEENIQK